MAKKQYTPPKKHAVSRQLIKEHGLRAAILLGFIARKIRKSKNVKEDVKWYYESSAGLHKHFPYITRSTINEATAKLAEDGALRIGCHNKWPRLDKTQWFTFAKQGSKLGTEKDQVWFHVKTATRYGIVAAILIENIMYWFNKAITEGRVYDWHTFSCKQMTTHLPFSEKEMHSALARLVKANVLEKRINPDNKTQRQYRFSAQFAAANSDRPPTVSDTPYPNLDKEAPISDKADPISDKPPTKSDNNTHLKNLLEEPLEEPLVDSPERNQYKDSPASPPVVCSNTEDKTIENQNAIADMIAEAKWELFLKEHPTYEKEKAEQEAIREKFKSPTRHQEKETDLSPDEKVTVLRNAIKSQNETYPEQPRIATPPNSFKLAKDFFTLNPHLSVYDVMDIMGFCVFSADRRPEGYDPIWHVRRGTDVRFFFKQFELILKELEEAIDPDDRLTNVCFLKKPAEDQE
jgi:hypothetical protein